jgi:hypothetical protein
MVATAERGIVTPHQESPLSPVVDIKPYAERLEERRQQMLAVLPKFEISGWAKDAAIYKDAVYEQLILDTTPEVGIWEFTVVDPLGVFRTNHFAPLENYNDIVASLDTEQHYSKPDEKNINDFRHRRIQYLMYNNLDFFKSNVFAPFSEEVDDESHNKSDAPEDAVLIEVDLKHVGRIDLLFAFGGTRFHIVEIGPRGKNGQAENYAIGLRNLFNLPEDRVTWSVARYGEVDQKGGEVTLICQNGHKRYFADKIRAA